MSKTIMGIKLLDRMEDAAKFQSILSKYGCSIKTRLGLHMTSSDACSPSGLIVLEFVDDAEEEIESFEKEVKSLGKINIQKMVF